VLLSSVTYGNQMLCEPGDSTYMPCASESFRMSFQESKLTVFRFRPSTQVLRKSSDFTYVRFFIFNVSKMYQMEENELPKKILWTNPGGQRRRGRPKSRWIDGVGGRSKETWL